MSISWQVSIYYCQDMISPCLPNKHVHFCFLRLHRAWATTPIVPSQDVHAICYACKEVSVMHGEKVARCF